MSDLSVKNCEPTALAAGMVPRSLQEFLAHYRWQEDRSRDRGQQIVAREHVGPHSIGIIDETSDVKKGDKTPGVQRQWCATVGKTENCIVTVHLAYATGDFHCLLDGELLGSDMQFAIEDAKGNPLENTALKLEPSDSRDAKETVEQRLTSRWASRSTAPGWSCAVR